MAEYKEIVTKAVIAKGKKSTSNKYTLEPEEIPNTILGCWVINNTFNGTSVGDSIIVNGSFDVNVWYSYDNDSKTAVSTKKYNYSDTMHMSKLGIYNQLISENGEQFTAEEAQYAMDNLKADWNANALAKAKDYQESMAMSVEAIREQLTSEYGEQFTAEEADYAISNLN